MTSKAVALRMMSLLMGTLSQTIHGLLLLILVKVMGAFMLSVAVIEDIAEATNAFAKVFSGEFGNWLRHHKPLLVFGYGLALLSKPTFRLASDAFTEPAALDFNSFRPCQPLPQTQIST